MISSAGFSRIALILCGFALSSVAALAEDAVATTELNVRSGPGTGFAVVDVLDPGEQVTMSECQTSGWCYVSHDGPDGWVSATYLAPVPGAVGDSGPDCNVVIEIGPDGPSFRLECGEVSLGTAPEPEADPDPVEDDVGACFWRNTSYTGATFCGGPGTLAQLEGQFNDSLSSVRLYGGAKVKLCEESDLDGYCRTLTADTPSLGPLINNRASSLVIYTGATPPVDLFPMPPIGPIEAFPFPLPVDAPPVTLSTGTIDLPQTWQLDLETGEIGSGGGADLWFRAQTATDRFLQPVGGAGFALGDGSNRGRDGCRDAAYSADRIALSAALVGRYVCIRTGEGRLSQIRVNALDGTILRLGYTTWSN
jgi:hypothetical protein